jgi:hypothetical protein
VGGRDQNDGQDGRDGPGRGPRFEVLDAPDAGRPVAAPLAVCTELLAVPVEQVEAAATVVAPYWRSDGEPVWSLHLLGVALGQRRAGWQTRRHRAKGPGARARRRAG